MASPPGVTIISSRGLSNYRMNPRRGFTFRLPIHVVTAEGVDFDMSADSPLPAYNLAFAAKLLPYHRSRVVDITTTSDPVFTGTHLDLGLIYLTFSPEVTVDWTWDLADFELSATRGDEKLALLSGVIAPVEGVTDGTDEGYIIDLDGGSSSTVFG